jgi:hypothetical protein
MLNSVAVAAAALVTASLAGCSHDAEHAPQPTAQLTVNNATRTTHEISCTQIESLLTIKATAAPATAQAIIQLNGDKPVVRTVNLTNFDGFHGVAGEGVGRADVTFANGTYTITGDAEGAVPDHPAESKTAPFRIQTPC